jgi:hypothetical protein
MRNYWLRIFLGAFAIFAIGMIGVTLIRSGVDRVHSVVEGTGPIEIPLRFLPFTMDGERLGTLERVIFYRTDSRRVRAVEVQIDLGDSLLARGLSGCRLAANLEGGPEGGVNIKASRDSRHAFSCLQGDSVPETMVEFGEAVFQPGDVRVPLFLQRELVAELEEGFGGDSGTAVTINGDSIASEVQREVDSALAEAGLARSAGEAGRSLGDSLRDAARTQLDSARRALAEEDSASRDQP